MESSTPPCYSIQELMRMIASRVITITDVISDEKVLVFLQEICDAKRIYTSGAGRSGLIARAFAMRLMHMGMDAYVVGETITPAMEEGDTLVAFSGSGETHSIVEICETAKSLGGRLCLVTARDESSISRIADCNVVLDSFEEAHEGLSDRFEVRQLTGTHRSLSMPDAPLGTIFETAALVFSDAVLLAIMEIKHCRVEDLIDRLANIQ